MPVSPFIILGTIVNEYQSSHPPTPSINGYYSATFYQHGKNHSHLHNLACRATIEIVRDTTTFHGIIDIKTGDSKGIFNVNGIVKDAAKNEKNVQRMVLFTHSSYGSSPVWVSQEINI